MLQYNAAAVLLLILHLDDIIFILDFATGDSSLSEIRAQDITYTYVVYIDAPWLPPIITLCAMPAYAWRLLTGPDNSYHNIQTYTLLFTDTTSEMGCGLSLTEILHAPSRLETVMLERQSVFVQSPILTALRNTAARPWLAQRTLHGYCARYALRIREIRLVRRISRWPNGWNWGRSSTRVCRCLCPWRGWMKPPRSWRSSCCVPGRT